MLAKHGVDAPLVKKDEQGDEHPIAFGSRGLNVEELEYSITHKGGLAVIFPVKKYRHHLLHKPFK